MTGNSRHDEKETKITPRQETECRTRHDSFLIIFQMYHIHPRPTALDHYPTSGRIIP